MAEDSEWSNSRCWYVPSDECSEPPCQEEEECPVACPFPGELSACVTFATQYRFRGVTQTDEEPTVQGGIDYSHDSGVYFGIWGSNVDFNDSDEAHMELDVFGGYKYQLDCLTIDLGAIAYIYPGAASSLDYDFVEVLLAVSYDFDKLFSLTGSLNYSPDYFGSSGHSFYPKLAVSVPLFCQLSLGAHVGYQAIEHNQAFGLPDYFDWGVFVELEVLELTFKLEYIDTDISSADCPDGCEPTVVLSLSMCCG